jgi:MOSC domain-containing protein YiiM
MQVIAISVGKIKNLISGDNPSDKVISSAIGKSPISTLDSRTSVRVRYLGIESDEQADLRVHGGEDKAIYAYPLEHYPFWDEQRSSISSNVSGLTFGAMGENLTISGFSEEEVYVGDRWSIGEVILEVAKFREPCFKFNIKMGWSGAAKAMIASGYSGWYLRVIKPGNIVAGDLITVIPGARALSIKQQAQKYYSEPKSKSIF